MKKYLALLLSVLMILSLAACGQAAENKGSEETSAPAQEEKGDPYTVTMAVIGNDQADMDKVEEKMNELLLRDLNAKIDVIPMGWGEFATKLNLMLSSNGEGEDKLDLVPIMYQLASTYVTSGQVIDLNDLIDEYGVNMKAAIGEDMIKTASMNGYVYGCPVEKEWYADSCLVMRKDILDKYNISVDGIDSLEDCEEIFKIVHENEPEMKIIVGAKGGLIGNIYFSDALSDYFGVLDNGGETSTVVNYYETENYKHLAGVVRDFYQKGYIDKDMATCQDTGTTILKAGNAFCFATPYKPGVAEQESLNTGYELVAVRINPPGAFCYTSAVCACTWGISHTCQDPVTTMKVLDYMYSSPEMMNLFNWGIEGEHYVVKDEAADTIGFPEGIDASNTKYNLNMGWELPCQFSIHVWEGSSKEIMQAQKDMNFSSKKSMALGFMFDATPVADELAALTNITDKYAAAIDCGAVDPEEAIAQMNEELYAAGLQKVIDEKQDQLNAWLEIQK